MTKNNKKIGIYGLVALLSLTAAFKNDIRASFITENTLQEDLDNNDFLTDDGLDYNNLNYADFLPTYYDNFKAYLSSDQKLKLHDLARHGRPEDTIDVLNDITNMTAASEGFARAFNEALVYSYDLKSSYYLGDGGLSKHLLTLKDLCHDDEAFYRAMFSENDERLIRVLAENTGTDVVQVRELALLFKRYNECIHEFYMNILLDNVDNITFFEDILNVLTSYDMQITHIIHDMIENKRLTDDEFDNSLLAQILTQSSYYQDTDLVTYERDILGSFDEPIDLTINGSYGSYRLTIPKEDLFKAKSLKDIAKENIDSYIVSDNNQSLYALLSLIMGDDNLIWASSFDDIYQPLKEFFKDEDDCLDFTFSLINRTNQAYDRFFDIYLYKLKSKELTEEDCWRYANFINLYKELTYTNFHYLNTSDAEKYTSEDILKMPKYDAQKIVATSFISSSLSPYCYDMEGKFREIESIFEDSNLPYSHIYLDNEYIPTWKTNNDIKDNVYMASKEVKYNTINYNGNSYVYYEVPEGYEDAEPVITFMNIAGIPEKCPCSGIRLNIMIENEYKEIFLINNEADYYPKICFLKAAPSLLKQNDTPKKEKV